MDCFYEVSIILRMEAMLQVNFSYVKWPRVPLSDLIFRLSLWMHSNLHAILYIYIINSIFHRSWIHCKYITQVNHYLTNMEKIGKNILDNPIQHRYNDKWNPNPKSWKEAPNEYTNGKRTSCINAKDQWRKKNFETIYECIKTCAISSIRLWNIVRQALWHVHK